MCTHTQEGETKHCSGLNPHLGDNLLHRVVNVFLGGETANAETQRRMRQVLLCTDRTQHVRRLERRRRARASGRQSNILQQSGQGISVSLKFRLGA